MTDSEVLKWFDLFEEKANVSAFKEMTDDYISSLEDDYEIIEDTHSNLSIKIKYELTGGSYSDDIYLQYTGHDGEINGDCQLFTPRNNRLDEDDARTKTRVKRVIQYSNIAHNIELVRNIHCILNIEDINHTEEILIWLKERLDEENIESKLIFNDDFDTVYKLDRCMDYIREYDTKQSRISINLYLKKKIDPNLIKSKKDPILDSIPKNIVDDFDTFIRRIRLSDENRRNLVNILKRGEWNNEKHS